MILRQDFWSGSIDEGGQIDGPTPEQLDAAISALNGWTRTQISLQTPDGTVLAVGGGREHFLVQYLLAEDAGEWLAVEAGADGNVELAIGRQAADYPRRTLVDLAKARQAATYFLAHGGRDPGLLWDRSF